ncbi:MAG: multidrug effflux MFS transporter [Clostridium sp.]|uniref:multidrug effflux MFS transporter n=1 Tax=Clostridium sp. TaxID=1506 RepID=UPI0025BA7B25|nr:multidrug effflux MFS transporter [Clostridium sp.]MCH3963136.1 multidrug effflux MFS transporter [Clostridium sp.]MCI1716401.1 multidrug effflux MFS transporter [Clostridium sp.]MCI1800741.1 multidrug effflux MFS transporter [Clostridium sp.]MCI1814604.1 multidrug effflux MFS transporter [Clostridium sp.]MCI1871514.1 multidrug effflux MFS transporter [Clostridium sp.]
MKKEFFKLAVILGILAGLGPLVTDLYIPSLPTVSKFFNASTSITQLSLTTSLLGLAIGQIIIGPISDKTGRRKPLILSLIIFTFSSLLCPLTSSIYVFILMRLLQGLAGAGGIVISRAMARDIYSGKLLVQFFSMLMLINGIAPIISPVLGAQLLKFVNWQGIFYILAILGLLLCIMVWAGIKESLSINMRSIGNLRNNFVGLIHLFKDEIFIGYTFIQGFILAGMFGYISASPFVIQDIYGLSAQQFSLCFAINGLGIVTMTQVTGHLAKKIPLNKILGVGLFISLLGSLVLFGMTIINGPLISILIPLFIVISSVGTITTTTGSLAMEPKGDEAGSASSLLGFMPFALGAIASPLVGIAGENTSVPMGIVILFCNAAAALIFICIISKHKKQLEV